MIWHSPNGQHHNQIEYILKRKHYQSGVNIARTWSFPGADTESDHNLLMMTFHLRLKRISKPKHSRLKFDLKKLKHPNELETFQVLISGIFALLTTINNDADMYSMINTQWLKQQVRSLANITRRKILGNCRNSWTVQQKERSEREKIWTWRSWEIQGCKQQHQEVHEKGKRKLDRRTV